MTELPVQTQHTPHGRTLLGGEPLVYHCNFYNGWLQNTLLLDPTLEMDQVMHDAAVSASWALLRGAGLQAGAHTAQARRDLAQRVFSTLGFGVMDLSQASHGGGLVRVPSSHYGCCVMEAVEVDLGTPQSYFDAGYAAAAVAFTYGLDPASLEGHIQACLSRRDPEGQILVRPRRRGQFYPPRANLAHLEATPPGPVHSTVDEAGILAALSGLHLSGNEEGLIPRFGVMLTQHLANFYNRVSFEFIRRMGGTGLQEAAESLLVDAGYRCAFYTCGGVMLSPEWDAVVRPQCSSREDWVHGLVAVINSLGWGLWRVQELGPDRLVVRIYDDYESCGWLDLYGEPSPSPVSFLARGCVAGLMNLLYVGHIDQGAELDQSYFARVFESPECFQVREGRSMAMGADYTEVIAQR
jgi:hypothetical protein